jgi:16S rRNA (guanine527-N7)-methyltransferase
MSIYDSIAVAGRNVQVPSENDITCWLEPYGVRLSSRQIEQIQTYIAVLIFWNDKINLTAIRDLRDIVCRHFGESLFFLPQIAAVRGRLADIGSGAGFPGLPIAIASANNQVVLIEQDARKSAFLNEVIRRLEVPNAKVLRSNYHALAQDVTDFDFITSRALGNYKELSKWAHSRLKPIGRLALWVGTEDAIKISRIKGWLWHPPFPIPDASKNVIVCGTPTI